MLGAQQRNPPQDGHFNPCAHRDHLISKPSAYRALRPRLSSTPARVVAFPQPTSNIVTVHAHERLQ
jgi:hypothetical protein